MHTLNKDIYILAICLSALAGCVDAIGFLQLGGYFISFMSGNSTRLAASVATGDLQVISWLGAILVLFVAGTALGTWVRHFSARDMATVHVLGFVSLLLIAAAASYEMGWVWPAIACMTLAMGAENAVFQRNGDVVVGLTYMTGTLVKIGQRLAGAVVGGPRFTWVPYLLLWMGLICGGVTGALLFEWMGLQSLWVAALWAALLTAATAFFKHRLVV